MSALQPAPIEGSDNGLDTTIEKYALSGSDYTSLKQYVGELESRLFASETEREALFKEFIWLLKDQPLVWRAWHLDNVHCYRLPESVMREVRLELRIPLKEQRCNHA